MAGKAKVRDMLQQSPTLRPFMRESIAFPLIAGRASKHRMIDIMAWGKFRTGNRKSMIEMIDIRSILTPLKFAKAIITGMFLGFQFGLNMLHRQRSLKISLTYMPFHLRKTLMSTILFAVTLNILFLPIHDFFMMGIVIERRVCKHLFSVLLIIPFVIFRIGISIGFILPISALFATWLQATSRMSLEELSSRGEPLQTFRTLFLRGIVLGYTVHDKGHSLSGSGCLQQRGASSCITPPFYHEPALQASLRKEYTHGWEGNILRRSTP
jgi:hypothetical protein